MADTSKAPVQAEVYTGLKSINPKTIGHFYQPPWGDSIPLPDNETDRQKAVDYYRRWYRIFPTIEQYNDYCLGGGTCPAPPDMDSSFYSTMQDDKPLENFTYCLPDGSSVPVYGSTRKEQIADIERLNQYYKEHPIGVTFSTGAKRSARADRFDLIPPCALKRLAKIYTEEAIEYGPHNWQKGMDWSDTINHGVAHLLNWLSGDRGEDHLAKAAWAIFTLMYFEETGKGNNDLEGTRKE